MSSFMGQIELFAFATVPAGWMRCEGQMLDIAQFTPLFALLGTQYGGDGIRHFALPDLRGRVPIGASQDFNCGTMMGEEAHALRDAEMPVHTHALMADAGATATGHVPSSATVLGRSSGQNARGAFSANLYGGGTAGAKLADAAVAAAGEGRAHENRMPSLALSYCICVDRNADFPPRGDGDGLRGAGVAGAVRSVLNRVTAPFRRRS